MTVELISVGTETLIGNIVNNNARPLAEKYTMLGFDLFPQITVRGNYDRMVSVIRRVLSCLDILILAGGPGPTEDDLTKEVCIDAFGIPLMEDAYTREHLKEFSRNNIYRCIPGSNWKMAIIPQGTLVLDDANGVAPGLILEKEGKTATLPPGPPNRLYLMFSRQVFPYLQQKQNVVLASDTVKICGCGGSQVGDMALDLINAQTNPTIVTYTKTAGMYLRITARVGSREGDMAFIAPMGKGVKNRFKDAVYITEEQMGLEMAVADLLKQSHLTMHTAGSCTRGMIAARMVNVPGVSGMFMRDMMTYSNEARMHLLGVREDILRVYDAVNEEATREMVEGGVNTNNIDLCVATTSIAGPNGGTNEKPVGLVYMACYLRGKTCVRRYRFKDNREEMQEQTMTKVLDLARLCILANK